MRSGIFWCAAGAVCLASAIAVDCFNWADKVLRLLSRASFELNAINTAAGAVQHLAVALAAGAGAVWLWNRRRP